ncbi:MAG: ATP-grasp domain-containing protein [Streptosporangiales bacterium]|nr:ATP-grasp domain-containing protein [Streptosporangiales bacterium]
MHLYLVALNPTDSVTHGFLPAAHGLGLRVTVLTDQPEAHETAYADLPYGPQAVLGCAVHEVRDVVGTIAAHGAPDAVFSNSDHLQATTALAAEFHGLPGKGWRAALRTKNKALMRRHLRDLDPVGAVEIPVPAAPMSVEMPPFPLVLKPREGVASEDVVLAGDREELVRRASELQARSPGRALIAEEYLDGPLHTLETLGDGRTTWVLGGFRTRVSAPPYFVEERLEWAPPPEDATRAVLARLAALGVGFGACHTEYVLQDGGPRLIEVNYRVIGDHCDFLLAELLGLPLFELILRVHLGERLSPAPPVPTGHAVTDYVIADLPGTLTAAPEACDLHDAGVRLSYRPLREVGRTHPLTNTNRDYLGAIRAVGPDRTTTEAAVARFRSAHRWEITP